MEFLPGVFRFRFGQPENGTPSQQMYVKPPRREAMAELPHAEPPFDASQIKFTVSRRGCRLELPLTAGEDIYGLGLNLKSLRHTG